MIDVANIKIKAGDGGSGVATFRREKYVPKGGPDGGDGGEGGDIFFVGNHNMATLVDFRSKKSYAAPNGKHGMGKNQRGPDGEDIMIKVPIGTLVYEVENDKETLVADIVAHGQKVLLAKGGKGGKGNYHFKSSTNQTPTQFTKGAIGEQKEIKLEIKLIADVGLVGAPNAGKSTLVNYLTNTQAKVASYPFTTLSPNLGVLRLKSNQKVIIADIPGLVEGAAEGKGLGDEFLRHIERTRVLVHIIDAFTDEVEKITQNALDQYAVISNELNKYSAELSDKKQLVVLNKIDITEIANKVSEIKKAFAQKYKVDILAISAATGEGVDAMVEKLTSMLESVERKPLGDLPTPVKKYTISTLPNKRVVHGANEVFEIKLPGSKGR